MKYHNITHDDMLNGEGLRVVLWLSGCSHHCPYCQNPETWSAEYGLDFDDTAKNEIFTDLDKDYLSGITFSGGDPLFIPNRLELLKFIEEIPKKYMDKKTIWVYTGYLYEEIIDDDIYKKIIQNIDVLLDGEFKIDLLSPNKHWVGSSNQRVIDCKKTLKSNKIVLYNN